MDLQMPGVNGIDAIATIRQEHPQARIIVLTTYEGDVLARRALKAGATGYILKDMIRTELLEAIRAVHLGRKYIPQKIAAELVDHCLHMRLHGCLRNGKVRSDYLVGRAARYFSKYFDFALAEIIFCIMVNQFSGDFLRYIFPSEMNRADRLQQLRPNHVF